MDGISFLHFNILIIRRVYNKTNRNEKHYHISLECLCNRIEKVHFHKKTFFAKYAFSILFYGLIKKKFIMLSILM